MNDRITNEFEESKLTAYVLGELDEHEIELIERAIEDDETLRGELDAIRATVSLLQGELNAEPAPTLTTEQREAIATEPKATLNEPSVFTMNRTRWIGSGLAAAAMIALTASSWLLLRESGPTTGFAINQPESAAPSANIATPFPGGGGRS